jgi:hypothetical protein
MTGCLTGGHDTQTLCARTVSRGKWSLQETYVTAELHFSLFASVAINLVLVNARMHVPPASLFGPSGILLHFYLFIICNFFNKIVTQTT